MFPAFTSAGLLSATRRSLVHNVLRTPRMRFNRQYATNSSQSSSRSNRFAGSSRSHILLRTAVAAALVVGLSEALVLLRVGIQGLPKHFAASVEMRRPKGNLILLKGVIMLHRKSSIWPYVTSKAFFLDLVR